MMAHEQNPAAGRRFGRLARLLTGAGFILFYYAGLRLHYFTSEPVVASAAVACAILAPIIAAQFWLALRWDSPTLAGLAGLQALIWSLLADTTAAGLPLLAAAALVAALLALRRDWWPLLSVAVVFVYAGHLLWLMNNPLAGNPVGAILPERYALTYLFACAAAFAWPALVRNPGSEPSALLVVLLNSLSLSVLTSLAVFALYGGRSPRVYALLAAFFLLCSVAQWRQTRRQFEPALYACSGYLALTLAIYDYRGTSTLFFWLALQSLVVISMALWFRSKFLVVTNCVLFLCILAAYMTGFPSSNAVTFSFALVAHLSARLMNWQKNRLTLRTEALRNTYLATGFILVLYALGHSVPEPYVALGWLGAGAAYFGVGLALRNRKYRYLAAGSVLAAAAHLVALDMPRLLPDHRGVTLLCSGAAALALSVLYARWRSRRSGPEPFDAAGG